MTEVEGWVKQAGIAGDEDKLEEALALCNKVLEVEPDNYKALFTAGSVLLKAGKWVHASQMLRRVCELQPKAPQGWGQLAHCCAEQHRYDDSIRYAERALALRRESRTLADAAYVHVSAGNWTQAEAYAREALALDPSDRDTLYQVANCNLARQNWREGWKGYHLTQRTKWRKEWVYGDSVEWQGEPDAVVMVTGEQGLGDEIMAASVVPDAAAKCKRFILDCDHRLVDLFRRSFPGAIVTPTRRERTVQLPILPTHHKTLFGLCELFRNRDEDFPRQAYIKPNPQYRAMFRALFDTLPGAERGVTGLAWSGGYPRTGESQRRAGVESFLPLIRQGGAFVSLQYKDDADEVAQFERAHRLKVHRFPWVTQAPDMDVLAGLIAALDRVVGVHTAALHLSSAMGVPTTILTRPASGWVYAPKELLWYPKTTQTFRKESNDEPWTATVSRLVYEQARRAA